MKEMALAELYSSLSVHRIYVLLELSSSKETLDGLLNILSEIYIGREQVYMDALKSIKEYQRVGFNVIFCFCIDQRNYAIASYYMQDDITIEDLVKIKERNIP